MAASLRTISLFMVWFSIGSVAGVRFLTPIKTAGTFSPANLTSLNLWLDANNVGSPPSSGSGLSAWNDLSGNHYDFAQATGSRQPVYNTNVLNGLPGIQFTGSTCMTNSGMQIMNPTGPFTIFFVFKNTSITAVNTSVLMNWFATTGNNPQLTVINNSANYQNVYFGSFNASNPRAQSAFSSNNTPYIGTITYDGSSTFNFYSANVSQTVTSGSTDNGNPATNILGDQSTTCASGIQAYLFEMVVTGAVASSGERANMQTYFINKWGSISP